MRKMLHGAALLAATLPFTVAEAQEADPIAPDRGEQIDALFADGNDPKTPGAAIAVVEDGEIVHSRGYGCAQLEYGIEIGADTVFHVASVSKQFTAMAVVLLALEGRLSLDDEVGAHLEWFPDFGVPIKICHLLNHTSGLQDQWELLAIAGWRLDDVITREHIIGVVKRQRDLNFPPGDRYLYSNTGYTLLAEIVTQASDRSFTQYTREQIFEPLGMASTHFHDDHQHVVPNRAYSYEPSGDGFRKKVLSYANVGATSLFTTATNLALWLANFGHHRVGGPEAIELLCERGVLNDGSEQDYAAGVIHGRHRGYETISHSGGDAGFRSHVVWFPHRRLGIAIVSNLATFSTPEKAMEVAALFVTESREPEPRRSGENMEPGDETPPRSRERVEIAKDRLAQLEGVYATSHDFTLRIERSSRRLYCRISGHGRRRIVAESDSLFRTMTGDIRLRFLPGGELPGSVVVSRGGDDLVFTRRIPGVAPALDLAEHAGTYTCPELDTSYTFLLEGDRLVVDHFRHGRLSALEPGWPDEFRSGAWFLSGLEFTRDADGRVDGFLLQTDRTLNLRFVRVDHP